MTDVQGLLRQAELEAVLLFPLPGHPASVLPVRSIAGEVGVEAVPGIGAEGDVQIPGKTHLVALAFAATGTMFRANLNGERTLPATRHRIVDPVPARARLPRIPDGEGEVGRFDRCAVVCSGMALANLSGSGAAVKLNGIATRRPIRLASIHKQPLEIDFRAFNQLVT